jgi:hypothetical protein
MKRYILLVTVILGAFLSASRANAAGGVIRGTMLFYQNQGGFCPSGRNCTGATYLQSEFNTGVKIGDIKVYVRDQNSAIIGQGTTDWAGNFTVSWFRATMPTSATVEWASEHKDTRYRITTPDGVYLYRGIWNISLVDGTTALAPQNLGGAIWGWSGAPDQVLNAYDGAWKMWNYALLYSLRMTNYFTNVQIRAFSNTVPAQCPTSCALNGVVQLDTGAAFAPQARVMHEMGHIARERSRQWTPVTYYAYPATTSGGSWSLNTQEWLAPAFEEGIATFIADVALYWYNAPAPHTCFASAAACPTGNFNTETSDPAGFCTTASQVRWPLSQVRYLWDNYDTQNDGVNYGESIQRPYSEFFEVLANYTSGYGDHHSDEPYLPGGSTIDDLDGRSALDFSFYNNSLYGLIDFSSWGPNCAQ